MALSSFNGGQGSVRIVGSDGGQDVKIGADAGTEALNVAGSFFFQQDFIEVLPEQRYQAFLNMTVCMYKDMIKQLRIMNQHLASISDLEEMEIEPGTDEGAL